MGVGEDPAVKRSWVADTCPWAELAPCDHGGGYGNCEVKINGDPHEPSATALAAMNWPHIARMSTAKVVLVHPEDTTDT